MGAGAAGAEKRGLITRLGTHPARESFSAGTPGCAHAQLRHAASSCWPAYLHQHQRQNPVTPHCQRLAADEGLSAEDTQLVELCALLHDVEDWKYAHAASEASTVQVAIKCSPLHRMHRMTHAWQARGNAAPPSPRSHGASLQGFLETANAPGSLIAAVQDVISCIGFKDELGGAKPLSPVAAVVQDADRCERVGT